MFIHNSKHFAYVASFVSHMNLTSIIIPTLQIKKLRHKLRDAHQVMVELGFGHQPFDSCAQPLSSDPFYGLSSTKDLKISVLQYIAYGIRVLCHGCVNPLPFPSWTHRPHIPALELVFNHETES